MFIILCVSPPVILVEDPKSRLLYFSVFQDTSDVSKSLTQMGGSFPSGCSIGFPSHLGREQGLNSPNRDFIIPEISVLSTENFSTAHTGGVEKMSKSLLVRKSLTYSGHPLQDRYRFAGFDISIENKKGSTRSGTDKDGHEWSSKMFYDYGYIRGTVGVDTDHLDVYIGPHEDCTELAYGPSAYPEFAGEQGSRIPRPRVH